MKTFPEILSKAFYAILILFVSAGCGPQKRLTKLLSQNPDLIQQEVVVFDTTITTRAASFDSVFTLKPHDSITIHDTATGVILKINRQGDRFAIDLKKQPDTILLRKTIKYDLINTETQRAIRRNISWKTVIRNSIVVTVLIVLVTIFKRLVK